MHPNPLTSPPPSSSSPSPSPSPSPHLLVPQVMAAMLQRRPFSPSLSPSPLFLGFSSASVSAILSSLLRFLLFHPRSHGRQSPSPSLLLLRRRPLRPPSAAAAAAAAAAQALAFYSWVELRCGFAHDELTCRAMARVLARARALPALWRFLRCSGTLVTAPTITSVIQTLGEEGLAKQALAAFYRMKQLHCKPDVRCYNAVIAALCRAGWFKKARFLLDQMELPGARCPPDSYTYTIFITFYCKRSLETGCRKAIRRRIWEANHMFRRMVFNGFTPDVVTYNCLIDGLSKTYRIGRAHELFDEMSTKGCSPNRVTYNSFIRYYSAVNEVDKAVKMMRDMVERNHGKPTSSSYTPIIHSLCESRRVKEARNFLVEMVEGGHVPREFTYKLVRNALDRAGGEGLPEEKCRWIEDGIDVRIKQVMRVKPLMRR